MIRCKTCQAPIVWARTDTGALMPLDAELVTDGTANVVVGQDGIARVVSVGAGDRISHFATCPGAAEHRRSRIRKR